MHKFELLDSMNNLLQAESRLWALQCRSPSNMTREDSSHSLTSPGNSGSSRSSSRTRALGNVEKAFVEIIRNGRTIEDIYLYFLRLNPLRPPIDTQLKATNNSFKTIQEKPSRKWSSYTFPRRKRSQATQSKRDLTTREAEVYKHALLCAQCLVLCSPNAPPTASPFERGAVARGFGQGTREDVNDDCIASNTTNFQGSPDNISIEQEALFSLLRNAFGVNMTVHNRLLVEVREMTSQAGGRTRLLVKDLWDHRLRIEYNDHRFYKARSFKNVDCYARWRSSEIANAECLIEKVTGCKPNSVNQGEGRLITINGHQEYEILQEKLFKQEMKTRKEVANGNENYVVSPSVISTASQRLLKEFGLRYGVGRSFRTITEFACMARHFEVNNWYMRCIVQALDELMTLVSREHEGIVSDELHMLRIVLEDLHKNLEYIFIKIKSLCPKVLPYNGVSILTDVLEMVLGAKIVLGLWDDEGPSLGDLLQEYVKTAVRKEYRRCRDIIFADSDSSSENDDVSPRSLQLLLNDLRIIMKYFQQLEKGTGAFSKHINIIRVVGKTLYDMFMLDVKELCVQRTVDITTESVDAEMYKLAFRLAQLDEDWAQFIPCSEQKWRTYYILESRVIMSSVGDYLNKMVKEFILNDKWAKIEVEVKKGPDPMQSPTPDLRDTNSPGNLIPSRTSAFSTFGSQTTSPVTETRSTSEQSEIIMNVAECTLYKEIERLPQASNVQPTEDDSSVDDEVAHYSLPRRMTWTPVLNKQVLTPQAQYTSVEVPRKHELGSNFHSDSKVCEKEQDKPRGSSALAIGSRNGDPAEIRTRLMRTHSLSNLNRLDSISDRIEEKYAKDDNCLSCDTPTSIKDRKRRAGSPISASSEASCDEEPREDPELTVKSLRKSESAPSFPAQRELHRCNTHTISGSSEAFAESLRSCKSKSSGSLQYRTASEQHPPRSLNLESIESGSKLQCYFTSSVVDLLTAMNRYCVLAGDIVALLIPPIDVDSDGKDVLMRSQLRNEFFDRFMRAVGEILITYAQGLLTMDLCGISKRVMTGQTKKTLMKQQNGGLILGCRHEPRRRYYSENGGEFCPTFKRARKFFPAEWEPVDVAMCNRLNNLCALIDVLPVIHKMACSILAGRGAGNNSWDDEDVPDDTCSELKLCGEQLNRYFRVMTICIAFRTFAMYSALLESLFHLNLPCVKYIKRRRATFGDQMLPVYRFISSKVGMFTDELSPGCAKYLVKELWTMIVEDFHRRIGNLPDNFIDATYRAKEIIILVPLLLNAANCIDDKDFAEDLVALSEPVLFRAELYTLSCERLRLVYNSLDGMEEIGNDTFANDEVLLHLRRKLPASFTGKEFHRTLLQDLDWLSFMTDNMGFMSPGQGRAAVSAFGNYLLQEEIIECRDVPKEFKREQGVAIVSPKGPKLPVMMVSGKMMQMPRYYSEESLLSDGSDTRPATSLSTLEEEDPFKVVYDSEESDYALASFGCWTRSMVARLRLLVRYDPTYVTLFREDIKQVLLFRCLVKRDTRAEEFLQEIDPSLRIPRPVSCPCV